MPGPQQDVYVFDQMTARALAAMPKHLEGKSGIFSFSQDPFYDETLKHAKWSDTLGLLFSLIKVA